MTRLMRRAVPILLASAVIAFVAAGCGGGGLALDPVASAATKTQQASSYAFDFTASMQIMGQQLSFNGSGRTDSASGSAEMTMDFKGLPPELTKNGSTAQLVLTGGAMYMKMPFLAGQLPSGKQWMKLDLASVAKAGSVGSFDQVDPQQWLQQLLASTNTRKVGTDVVQGEQMTHYSATVDPSKLSDVPADKRAAVRKALQRVGMTSIPVEVWVDGQGLLRRESMTLDFGKALQGSTMSMTFDLHDFGTAVNVTAPPADQVFDATALVQQSGAGAGAAAATSEWATRANKVCRAVYTRYAQLGSAAPKTFAAKVKLAHAIVPVEQDELAQLTAISAPKSAAATKALSLLRADLAEGRAAVAAAGNHAAFDRLFRRWENDRRAVAALGAAGASDCS
jgi:LppX_LprAFG lipoprotein